MTKPKKTKSNYEKNRKPIASDFGTYLYNLRVERNLSAKDVAPTLGLSERTIHNIENGYNPPPSPERLRMWLQAIGCKEKYSEAMTLLSSIKLRRYVTYQPRNPANEHLDRLIDAYDSGTLTKADLEMLRMIAPHQYHRA